MQFIGYTNLILILSLPIRLIFKDINIRLVMCSILYVFSGFQKGTILLIKHVVSTFPCTNMDWRQRTSTLIIYSKYFQVNIGNVFNIIPFPSCFPHLDQHNKFHLGCVICRQIHITPIYTSGAKDQRQKAHMYILLRVCTLLWCRPLICLDAFSCNLFC